MTYCIFIKVFLFVTAKNVWHPAIDTNQIPVRCDVQGKRWTSRSSSHPFHHVYEFTDYRPGYVFDKDFEVTTLKGNRVGAKVGGGGGGGGRQTIDMPISTEGSDKPMSCHDNSRSTRFRKGRKEGNVLFNNALDTFYLRLYVASDIW